MLPQTQFTGPSITGGPVPATIALPLLEENEWIVAVRNNQLKMVKLRVTGANSYEWIATKYAETSQYHASCLESFSESCFAGNTNGENSYIVKLVAEGITIIFDSDILINNITNNITIM